MLKTLAITAILCAVAVAAEGQPLAPYDVGCETADDMRRYNECTGNCKKTSNAAQNRCNDAYKKCRTGCTARDKAGCRDRCRSAYRECSNTQRAALKKCRADCITANNCQHIPGTPE